ncbi:hypothetical protein E0L16_15595 [Enterobacter quasihormaechei]|uniref:Uncharacterized protein n=1 Tax=Enterobacter quasihormaechei TaxID=2529382 RepID=A0AAE8QVT4_9ENTR|nr:hypothetical protein DP185_12275 [Enterobacter hormaechei]TCB84645.1 hypothetical protein E0L16_15595 [Enterobacter quasihormaechei]
MGLDTGFSSVLMRDFFALCWMSHRLRGTAQRVKLRWRPQCRCFGLSILDAPRYNPELQVNAVLLKMTE